MKVDKSVTLNMKQLLELVNKAPGLNKVTSIDISGGYSPYSVTGSRPYVFRCMWSEEEIIDGVYGGKGKEKEKVA